MVPLMTSPGKCKYETDVCQTVDAEIF